MSGLKPNQVKSLWWGGRITPSFEREEKEQKTSTFRQDT